MPLPKENIVPLAQPSRRQVVAAAVGAGSLVAIAACSGGSSSGGSGSGGGAGSGGAVAAGTVLTPLSAVPVGSSVAAKDASGPILVAQPTAGKVVAFSAICTHQGCTVAAAGAKFQCPCHGSTYDAATGAVLKGPAARPLTPVQVHVDGGNVVTG
jgi:Rieske Fe-S protein